MVIGIIGGGASGMAAALACVVQVHDLVNKRPRWPAIMMIPATIMISKNAPARRLSR